MIKTTVQELHTQLQLDPRQYSGRTIVMEDPRRATQPRLIDVERTDRDGMRGPETAVFAEGSLDSIERDGQCFTLYFTPSDEALDGFRWRDEVAVPDLEGTEAVLIK